MEKLSPADLFRHILLADFLRYFIAASLAYLFFWVVFKKKWQHRIIQHKAPQSARMRAEFAYSLSTVLVFAAIGWCIISLKRLGYTLIYNDFDAHGWPWFAVSLLLMLLLHDAYFYWTHRMMHHPRIFRHVHLVHHRSTNPSPWAAYAFHPLEAVVEAGVFVVIVFVIPAHPLALSAFLIYMIVRNVLGHVGIEFLPSSFMRNPWFNWHTTTTHHDLHHRDFHHNYGLYFTWWDRWFGTEHPRYRDTFEEVATRPKAKPLVQMGKSAAGSAAMLLAICCGNSAHAQSPIGTWQTIDDGDGKARSLVQIVPGDSGGLSGKVLEIYPRGCEPADPLCVKCTGERKNAPIRGMYILWGFKDVGGAWTDGSILDPANGRVYRCKIWLEEDGKVLKVRGYWGIFWRTQKWLRV
jgi:sterol desaturase/sphingolipid hydroxylase (fatty acid hydroxylase superfamily)